MQLEWEDFKKHANDLGITIQFIQMSSGYRLLINNGELSLSCILLSDFNQSEIIDFETNYKSKGNQRPSSSIDPFSAKKINGKSLFKRVHGVSASVAIGASTLEFVIPYALCKITGVEVVGAVTGDTCDFEVWMGNTKLNQFGFDVFLAKDFYSHHSEYDSDLPMGLKIKMIYKSVSEKVIGFNLILNEVK